MTQNEMKLLADNAASLEDSVIENDRELRAFAAETKLKREIFLLREIMKDDIASFRFRKSDGTLRQAFGTRCREIIDNFIAAMPQQNTKKRLNTTFTYFDIEKKGWRSMTPSSLIEINKDYVED